MSDDHPDWAFARTPKWIAGHVLATVLLVLFVSAGIWQWSRHREVSARNDRIEARQDLPAVGFDDLGTGPPADIEFRRAELTGEWDPDGQVAIRNRSFNGGPGCHVVTPLLVDGAGSDAGRGAVLVTRGWVPLADCDEVGVAAHPPPAGTWTVTGLVRPTQTRGSIGARDDEDGVLRTLSRVDVERIDQQYDADLAPVYVESAIAEPAGAEAVAPTTTDPAVLTLPAPVPPPSLGAGPHLGYTLQWFSFALVALIGYPIVLRRHARPDRGPRHGRPPVTPPTPAGGRPHRPSGPPAGRAPPASSRS